MLIYGSEKLVVTDAMLKVLEGLHHQLTLNIAGMSACHVGEGGWDWSSVAEALEVADLWPLNEYIQRRQANIAEYITNHPIYELCMGVDQMPGSSMFLWWWY